MTLRDEPEVGIASTERGAQPRAGVGQSLARAAWLAGSAGLLLAMALDTAAVVGRIAGVPLLGSLELIQACVVVAASTALIGATLSGSHAAVQIVTERLAPARRGLFARASDLLCALFFAWLAAGSIWVAAELWPAHEATELLRLPIAPLRLFWCGSVLLVVVLYLAALMGPPGERS